MRAVSVAGWWSFANDNKLSSTPSLSWVPWGQSLGTGPDRQTGDPGPCLWSASHLVPQSEVSTELDQSFQFPKHLIHAKNVPPFLVPKISGAQYSCIVPGSLVTGPAARIGLVI